MGEMSMSEERLNTQDIVKLAAGAGAKAALETVAKERQREHREMADRRLRNTKLLLRNYRVFRAHVENAVFEVTDYESPEEILTDLMMPGRDNTLFVESIKRSVARTATIVKHMETMMQLYHAYCVATKTAEDERRWRVINALYICEGDGQRTIPQMAKDEGVVERTIYKDIDIACERIAALMFGVDGLKRK
jgi:CheY-like chemotaxis protein